jgi:outer membrane protein assembly factor BamB
MTTAAVFDGTIFVASNTWTQFGFVTSGMHAAGDTATLYALDAETGIPRWTVPVDAPVFGSFAVSNGMLFHSSIRGSVYARLLETGQELWRTETQSPIGSGVSVTADHLFVSGGFAMSVRATTAEAHVVAFSLAPQSKVVVDARG